MRKKASPAGMRAFSHRGFLTASCLVFVHALQALGFIPGTAPSAAGKVLGARGGDDHHLLDRGHAEILDVDARFDGEYLVLFQGHERQVAVALPGRGQQGAAVMGIASHLVAQRVGIFVIALGDDVAAGQMVSMSSPRTPGFNAAKARRIDSRSAAKPVLHFGWGFFFPGRRMYQVRCRSEQYFSTP